MKTTPGQAACSCDNVDWLKMEKDIRWVLRLVNQQCVTEERLRDALTNIDEIVCKETERGREIYPGLLSGERAIAIHLKVWQRK